MTGRQLSLLGGALCPLGPRTRGDDRGVLYILQCARKEGHDGRCLLEWREECRTGVARVDANERYL